MEHLGPVGLAGSQHELLFADLTGLDLQRGFIRAEVIGGQQLPEIRFNV